MVVIIIFIKRKVVLYKINSRKIIFFIHIRKEDK